MERKYLGVTPSLTQTIFVWVDDGRTSAVYLLAEHWRTMRRIILVLSAVILIGVWIPVTNVAKAAVEPTVPTTVVTTTTVPPLVSAADMSQWAKVAWCETHSNWKHQGWLYEGGLGILHSNWAYYGGYKFAPHAWLATPEQQVYVAKQIQQGLGVPDQNGTCHAW